MMFDEDLCFWSWEEDIITCKFYLDHLNDWSKNLNISKLVEKLKMFGYIKNAYDVRIRLSNYAAIRTGVGDDKTNVQEKRVYELLEEI